MSAPTIALSIVIPVAAGEDQNLADLLPRLRETADRLSIPYELLVVLLDADDRANEIVRAAGARAIVQTERGYGGALLSGFREASGAYILTMDVDFSHPPAFVEAMWSARATASIVIASRYVRGGRAQMPIVRYLLSRVLNVVFSRGLSLHVRDMSSGFRLHDANVLRDLRPSARDFDIVQEVLVRAYAEGWTVREIPFTYEPRRHGWSHARVFRFGVAYLRTFWRMWKLRNSILAADYDDRAYDSIIPLQKYWQRRRFKNVVELIAGRGAVLDIGCGSSRIISALPKGSVGVDLLMRKLRYARRFGTPLVQASGGALPFGTATFPCVLCSQVIEHVPPEVPILDEIDRVLIPGGRLVVGTPDYARWQWRVVERLYHLAAPGAYADEHVTHYTRRQLVELFERRGYVHEAARYILRGELILAFRKPVSRVQQVDRVLASAAMA